MRRERQGGRLCQAVSRCAAGCVLGDFIGAWLVSAGGSTVGGSPLYVDFLLTFVLARVAGIAFQAGLAKTTAV